jgi:hypothetical protein
MARTAPVGRSSTPTADATADHFHLDRWRTKAEFLAWLHRDGYRVIHPYLAIHVCHELPLTVEEGEVVPA